MKKTILPLLVVALLMLACKKDQTSSSLEKKYLGNWLVVDDNNQEYDAEWHLFFVNSVKLYSDRTFQVNLDKAVDTGGGRQGTWKLNAPGDSIVFFTRVTNFGMDLFDTTGFHISLDSKDRLVLENKLMQVKHRRMSN